MLLIVSLKTGMCNTSLGVNDSMIDSYLGKTSEIAPKHSNTDTTFQQKKQASLFLQL
jgi:hypothetical protein